MNQNPIHTERLILQPISWQDAEDIFEYASQPEVTRFLSFSPHKSIDDSYAFISKAIGRMAEKEFIEFAIHLKESQKCMGTIGIDKKGGTITIGYASGKPYWGKGYMTEALKGVIARSLEDESICRVDAIADVDNTASWKLMEKCGMEREGRLRNYVVVDHLEPKERDVFMYSIVR
ncbi:MAG: GNAT family N-acetyltransferase [Bacteroidota bacterium]